MELKNVFTNIIELLRKNFSDREAEVLTFEILSNSLMIDRRTYTLYPTKEITEQQYNKLLHIVDRLLQSEPIEYVYNEAVFLDAKFFVNEKVLIPRPETEELVDLIIKQYKNNIPNKVLDIGTGSGCIPITLSKNWPDSAVEGWDVSPEALEVANENARRHKVKTRFRQIDILNFNVQSTHEKFDVIVSNPPYVLEKDKLEMQKNVLEYEPHLALFVPNENPLLFYKSIAEIAKFLLNPGGGLYFEIHEAFGQEMLNLMKHYYVHVELVVDLNDKPRMIHGIKSNN